MDIRIVDGEAELFECEKLNKEELEFILFLIDKGGYWELRKRTEIFTLHDKDNFKYKGSIEELKNHISSMKKWYP